jgi:hypothetical protein
MREWAYEAVIPELARLGAAERGRGVSGRRRREKQRARRCGVPSTSRPRAPSVRFFAPPSSLRAPCRAFMPLVIIPWTVPCLRLVSLSVLTVVRTYTFFCRALSFPPGCKRVANAPQVMHRPLGLGFQHDRATRGPARGPIRRLLGVDLSVCLHPYLHTGPGRVFDSCHQPAATRLKPPAR